jgi:hypothetical protein
LPFLILLACPLMHIFMHHGHHHHGSPPSPSEKGSGTEPDSAHNHH